MSRNTNTSSSPPPTAVTAGHWVRSSAKSLHTKLQHFSQQSMQASDHVMRSTQPHVEAANTKLHDLSGRAVQESRALVQATHAKTRELGRATQETSHKLGAVIRGAIYSVMHFVRQGVARIGSVPIETDEKNRTLVRGASTDPLVTFVHPGVVHALAAVGFVSGLLSFWLSYEHLVTLSSLLVLLLSPLVVYQKCQLVALGILRTKQKQAQNATNQLMSENDKFTQAIRTLSKNVESLDTVEPELETVANRFGSDIHSLVDCVSRFQNISQTMQASLRAQIMQEIMTAMLQQADYDQDFCLQPNEVLKLEARLSNLPGVQFDSEAFHQLLLFTSADKKKIFTMADLCAVARNLQNPAAAPQLFVLRLPRREQ